MPCFPSMGYCPWTLNRLWMLPPIYLSWPIFDIIFCPQKLFQRSINIFLSFFMISSLDFLFLSIFRHFINIFYNTILFHERFKWRLHLCHLIGQKKKDQNKRSVNYKFIGDFMNILQSLNLTRTWECKLICFFENNMGSLVNVYILYTWS